MASGRITPEVDLLHPLATLHWEHCHTWGGDVIPTHCAVLEDKVAILTVSPESCDVLYISSTDLLSWAPTTLPYQQMSLTTYHSKFVVVGGCNPSTTHECTDKLFTCDIGLTRKMSVPPMPTKRASTSSVSTRSPEVLVVAGGMSDGGNLDVVEVLLGNHWYTVAPLPMAISWMRSVFHNENLYFMGSVGHKNNAYTCSCSLLISLCEEFNNTMTTDTLLWRQFPAPISSNVAVSYSSYLVSIDVMGTMRAYSSVIQSWVEITSTGDRSDGNSEEGAAAVLPTGELVCTTRYGGVYRVKLSGLQEKSSGGKSWVPTDVAKESQLGSPERLAEKKKLMESFHTSKNESDSDVGVLQQNLQELKKRAEESDRRTEESDRRAEESDRRAEESDRRAEESDRRAEKLQRRIEELDKRNTGTCEKYIKVFKKEISTLVDAIHPSIGSVGDCCYSEELISDDVYEYLRLPAVTDREKARKLLINVKEAILQDPQALMKFLDLIKKKKICDNVIAQIERNL